MSEGIEVDSSSTSFALQSLGTVDIQLQVTPRQSGQLLFSGSVVSSVILSLRLQVHLHRVPKRHKQYSVHNFGKFK